MRKDLIKGYYIEVTYIEEGKEQSLTTQETGFPEAMFYAYSRHNNCEIIKMERIFYNKSKK